MHLRDLRNVLALYLPEGPGDPASFCPEGDLYLLHPPQHLCGDILEDLMETFFS